ncbi:hypothetical protein HDU86_006162 [Geranomyces michiganensis]|nr:hypothetical protein HDU86_006162 [Geranomyces michiganensis]
METSPEVVYTPDFAPSPPNLGLDHRSNDADDEEESDEVRTDDQQPNTDDPTITPSLSDVLRQAADKLATMVTMNESASFHEIDSVDRSGGNIAAASPPIIPLPPPLGAPDDELDALLDRREGEDATSGSESDWGKEVAEDAIARGVNTHPERPHPHVHRDLKAVSGEIRPEFAGVKPAPPATRETKARQRPATAPVAAKDAARWCRYYKGMPQKPFYGTDVKRYPVVDVARPWIVEGQRQELHRMNKSLLLRLCNPRSEVDNSTMIMSYLQRPARGERRSAPPRPPAPRPAPVAVKKRPQSSPYYARLAAPRPIPPYNPFPADFVPHPRRSARSAQPISPERIDALATRHRRPAQEDAVGDTRGAAKKFDPAVWDRLSMPKTRVVRRGGAPVQQRQSRPASAPVSTTSAAPAAAGAATSRRKPAKASAPPPKTSVLTGKYGAAAALPAQIPSTSRRSSGLPTVEDSGDEPAAEVLPHVLPEPPAGSASPNSQRVIRCSSIAEEDAPEDSAAGMAPKDRLLSSTHRPSKLRRSIVDQDSASGTESKVSMEAGTSNDDISMLEGYETAQRRVLPSSVEQPREDPTGGMLTIDEALLLARAAHIALPSNVAIEQLASGGTILSHDEAALLALAVHTPLPPSVAASIEQLAIANGGQVTREETLLLARAGQIPLPQSVAASYEDLGTRAPPPGPSDIEIGYRKVDVPVDMEQTAPSRPPPLTIPTSISTGKLPPNNSTTATASSSRSKSYHSLRTMTTTADNGSRSPSALSSARSTGSMLRSPARPSAGSPTKNKSMLLPSRENIPYVVARGGSVKTVDEPPLPQVPIRVGSRRTIWEIIVVRTSTLNFLELFSSLPSEPSVGE